MIPSTCPFLGLKDDPATSLSFPSEGNFCHKPHHPVPINREHQERYCLGSQHVTCPIFTKEAQILEPTDAVSPVHRMFLYRKVLGGVVVPVTLILIITLGAVWITNRGLVPAASGEESKNIQKGAVLGIETTRVVEEGSGGDTTLLTLTPTPISQADKFEQNAACDPPEGWMLYTVQPTDSIFRLSLVFGAGVEELQRANCLGENTIIRPGDEIFVPRPATSTPAPTNMPTPTRRAPQPTWTNVPDTGGGRPQSPPTNTPAPPTKPPPLPTNTTAPPTNTPVPPTEPPPTPTSPPEEAPTSPAEG